MSNIIAKLGEKDKVVTPTERIDHITDRARLCLVQAENIDTKLFGICQPTEIEEGIKDDPSLEGSISRACYIIEERLLKLLQEISSRL